MVLSSDLTKIFPSCVQTFLNKNLFLALVSICICFWVMFLVMLTTVSFNFFLFLNTLLPMLYLANLMMIGLDYLPFLRFPIRWLWSILIPVSFSCKSSFKVFVTTVSVSSFSHFPSHHATKYSFYASIGLACEWLYLNHQFFIHLSWLFFQFSWFSWFSPLSFCYLSPIRQIFHCKIYRFTFT